MVKKDLLKKRVLCAIEGIFDCSIVMDKKQIRSLPDLTRCDYYEFILHRYDVGLRSIGIYFHQNDIIIGILYLNAAKSFHLSTQKGQQGKDFQTHILSLAGCLNGDEMEKSFVHVASQKRLCHGSWFEIMQKEKAFLYYQELHAYVIQSVITLLHHENFTENEPYRILDLFGGDGRLVNSLIKQIQSTKTFDSAKFELVYIDLDRDMFAQAEQRLSDTKSSHFSISLFHFDLRSEKKPEIGMFDLVLCSGGLTGEVIDSASALSITKWVYDITKTNGVFIATGKADSHLNRQILSNIGFLPVNYAMMDKDMKFGIIQHYVSIKPEFPYDPQPSLSAQLLN